MGTQDLRILASTKDDRIAPSQHMNKNYGRDMNLNTGGGSLSTGPQYNVAGDLVQSFTSAVSNRYGTLWDMVAGVKASHNSDLQFERGGCLPGTREAIIEDIHRWRLSESCVLPVCWLYGAAGVGKSAVALTIAKACEGDGLAASFFFFRSDPKRNNPSALILTIAHGLTVTRPRTGRLINRRIAADPRILEASLEEQYRELVINALAEKKKSWWARLQERWSTPKALPADNQPNLIVIDGLDECGDAETQKRVLNALFSSFEHTPRTSLRFLICSRPESWIREAFESPQLLRWTKRMVLDNSFSAKKDIEAYLLHCFQELRESSKYAHVVFPDPWPAHHILELLVDKSCGQFVYVVTLIRFIKSDFAHPFEQLHIILNAPRPRSFCSPFHELDILYHIVLSTNPNYQQLVSLLAAIQLLPGHASPAFLEMLFELRSGAASLILRAMHSVLDIRGLNDPISIYHTSFTDFLKDESRSERFFTDLPSKRTSLLRRWGHGLMKRWKDNLRDGHRPSGRFPWTAWADFCLEFPSNESVRRIDQFYTTILSACSHHDEAVKILAAVILLPATTPVTPQYIETFLEHTPSQATQRLQELDWLLSSGQNERLTIAHTSLTSFLLDQSRSGRFFIDRDCHQDYFVRRWLRVYPLFTKLEGTPPLRSWHELCAKLDIPELCAKLDIPELKLRELYRAEFYQDRRYLLLERDKLSSWHELYSKLGIPQITISPELLDFYENLLYALMSSHDQLPSVMATIAVVSQYTKPSLELIDILYETSKDPDAYYYLHIGEEDSHPPTDSYPPFFDFLKDSCYSPVLPFTPGHQDFLARRMIESVNLLCQDSVEKY
ncbi:hypothetical protein V5O48_017636 [Marasmius crinis-equi]|uniref:Nephrocystin 3-like N-terminal domain-containing protein n=1 Tax=Marasmius crinis-equi TaxID=585013 RepID=A0ABR3ENL2_9AGAR